jgi:ribose transport system substrate-binding protein
MASMIKWLLAGDLKPGSVKSSMYTTLIPVTKANASTDGTCWSLDKVTGSH